MKIISNLYMVLDKSKLNNNLLKIDQIQLWKVLYLALMNSKKIKTILKMTIKINLAMIFSEKRFQSLSTLIL